MESERVNRISSDKLIKKFNLRDNYAFTEVYSMYYDTIHMFANKLFYNTEVDVTDLIQDIFIALWEHKSTKFETLAHIKSYLYLSVKNHFRNYIKHKRHVNKYNIDMLKDDDYYVAEMVEVEVSSRLSDMLGVLPSECSRVLKMYLEGLDIKDIAQRLGKSQSTIYNQKQAAITILKKKFGDNPIYSFIFYILGAGI